MWKKDSPVYPGRDGLGLPRQQHMPDLQELVSFILSEQERERECEDIMIDPAIEARFNRAHERLKKAEAEHVEASMEFNAAHEAVMENYHD